MLTKNDLSQIREIVREEITSEVTPLKKDVGSLKKDVGSLRADVNTLKEQVTDLDVRLSRDISKIQGDVRKIQKDVTTHADYFDKEYLEIKDRVKTVERHLSLNPAI